MSDLGAAKDIAKNEKFQNIRIWTCHLRFQRDNTKSGAIVSRRSRPREIKGCSIVVDVIVVDSLPSGPAAGATVSIFSRRIEVR